MPSKYAWRVKFKCNSAVHLHDEGLSAEPGPTVWQNHLHVHGVVDEVLESVVHPASSGRLLAVNPAKMGRLASSAGQEIDISETVGHFLKW